MNDDGCQGETTGASGSNRGRARWRSAGRPSFVELLLTAIWLGLVIDDASPFEQSFFAHVPLAPWALSGIVWLTHLVMTVAMRPRARPGWRALVFWLVFPTATALGVVALQRELALIARVALCEPALKRCVNNALARGGAFRIPCRAGLFRVDSVGAYDDPVQLFIGGMGMYGRQEGLAYLPWRRPPNMEGRSESCEVVHGSW